MFHVSTIMKPEEQRRLIGNDIGLIYFQEETPFASAKFRGSVNSVACVVRPKAEEAGTSYQVGSFRRSHIQSFSPEIPSQSISEEQLKDFLLTKMVNGIIAAQKAAPFNEMFAKLFKSEVKDILENFPPPKKSNKKKKK